MMIRAGNDFSLPLNNMASVSTKHNECMTQPSIMFYAGDEIDRFTPSTTGGKNYACLTQKSYSRRSLLDGGSAKGGDVIHGGVRHSKKY